MYTYMFKELGINFSHIQAKSLTVLNPLRRVDEHIMDDADLAGPLLFFLCFGIFLLFVSLSAVSLPSSHLDSTVRQNTVWLHLWCWPPRFRFHLHSSQSHV